MTKFFKNQPVRSDTSGMGVVYHVSDTSVGVQFGQCIGTFDLDGRRADGHPIDLHPLESGKIVLSEWQRKQLKRHETSTDRIAALKVQTDKVGELDFRAIVFERLIGDMELLLGRASELVGHPAANISGSMNMACDNWQSDFKSIKAYINETK